MWIERDFDNSGANFRAIFATTLVLFQSGLRGEDVEEGEEGGERKYEGGVEGGKTERDGL